MKENDFAIVVAEDDEDERMILTAVFEAIGCRVECSFVNSGYELLEYLERRGEYKDVPELPNLILVDLNRPEEWCDTVKRVKSEPAYDRIPVVVLISSEGNDDQRCLGLEADATVRKPLGFEKYVETLKSALAPFCEKAPD
jgi:CheY-like chemotaxis protein